MKIYIVVLILPILMSCFSHSEAEFKVEAEKMCKCINSADSISRLDTLSKMDFSMLNYSRCAAQLEVNPFSTEFGNALKENCPANQSRHKIYLELKENTFIQ